MPDRFCFSCHNNLTYISNRRLMCFACEKIYGEDYICQRCSVQRKTNVYMEVVAPGRARCIVCGQEKDAPGLNLETSMKRESITRLRRTLSSIPPRTSTGPNRIPGVSTTGGHRIRGLDEHSQGPSKEFLPHAQKSASGSSQKMAQFPERSEPDLFKTEGEFMVVAEFPRHKDENDIVWRIEQGILFLESKIEGCPYRDEVALPEWAEKPSSVCFRNGVFEMVFKKS